MEKETDMSDLDPADYENGQLVNSRPAAVPVSEVAVAAGETVNSADPSITVGPAKAIAASVATVAVTFLTALGVAMTDNVVTPQEWITIAVATIVGTGLVGGSTFLTRTTVTGNGH